MDKSLDRFLEGQLKKEATPEHIAEEMVALIPDEIIQNLDSKYLDINCKTGVFPIKIRDRLMRENKKLIEMFPAGQERERRKYIDEHCKIFGISWIKEYANRSRANIYGKATIKGKIHYVPEVKNENGKLEPAYKTLIAAKDNGKLLNDTIKEICDMQFKTDMSFDVVIGNPPYNDDMYLDFVTLSHRLASKYDSMIIPAKFVAKNGLKNEALRRDIVPYMSKIVYFPNCSDIFLIGEQAGIAYYISDKEEHGTKEIENRSVAQKLYNNTVNRELGLTLNNVIHGVYEYISKLGLHGEYTWKDVPNYNKYCLAINNKVNNERGVPGQYQAYGTISYATGKSNVICEPFVIEDIVPSIDLTTADKVIFSSENIEACNSVKSWLDTKLVRFFIYGRLCGISPVISDSTFAMVPAPPSGKFDHIFTDEELYEYFGFNKPEAQTKDGVRYRDIIEAVIKERN